MGKRVLVISPVATHPADWGCKTRVRHLASNIETLGHEVFFLHVEDVPGDCEQMRQIWGSRYHSAPYGRPRPAPPAWLTVVNRACAGRAIGEGFHYLRSVDDVYDNGLDRVLRKLQHEIAPDVVIAEYVFYSKALECFDGKALKVLDTHDIFSNRHWLFWKRGWPAKFYSMSRRAEVRGLERADVILAMQEEEAAWFSARCSKRVVTVGHTVELEHLPFPQSGRQNILFVGSENSLNTNGINLFIEKMLPRVRVSHPNAELLLAGPICAQPSVKRRDGVHPLGIVDDLRSVYARADVVINPVFVGTGLHIKNVEAMGFGKPLVVASHAARGLREGAGTAFLVADSTEAFAEVVTSILSNRSLAERLSSSAYRFAVAYNATVMHALAGALEST